MGSDVSLVSPHGQFLPPWFVAVSGIVLLLLIARGFLPRRRKALASTHQLYVPEMNCKHCKMTVENALEVVQGVNDVVIDLDSRTVGVDGEVNRDQLVQAIQDAGFAVEEKEAQNKTNIPKGKNVHGGKNEHDKTRS
jgi:copper chaperone CopZ